MSPKATPLLVSFNGGEVSPLLDARSDLNKYFTGCRKLENFIPLVEGGATRMPGTYYVKPTKSNGQARLVPFHFNTEQAYVLEFGDAYIRVFKDEGRIGGTITGAANNGVGLIRITSATHGLTTGDTICIEGVVGTLEANGSWTVTKITANTFDLQGSTFLRTYKSGGTWCVEVVSPYAEADLRELDVKTQSADTLYIFHPDYAPRTLTRTSHTTWTLSTITWINGPWLDERTDIVFTPSATSGSITLTASASYFDALMEGSLLNLKFSAGTYKLYNSGTPDDSANWTVTDCTIVQDTTASAGEGGDSYCYTITESASSGTQRLVRTVTGLTANTLYKVRIAIKEGTGSWASAVFSVRDATLATIYGERHLAAAVAWTEYTLFFRATATSASIVIDTALVGAAGTTLMLDTFYLQDAVAGVSATYGYVSIDTVSSATSAACTVITDLGAGATVGFAEGAWSDYRGWPACGTFYENSLAMAGTAHQPQTVWKTVSGTLDDFTMDADDDSAAVEYTLLSDKIDMIRWMRGADYLMIGTAGGVWKLGATSAQEPLTQTNVNAKKQIPQGAAAIIPESVPDGFLWVTRSGKKLKQLVYSYDVDKFISPDMTRIAEHITKGSTLALSGILETDFQKEPQPILWAIRADGQLLGMTYEIQEQIYAWFRVVTDGTFESVAVISADNEEDQIWVIVNRTINNKTVRYVEYFKSFSFYSQIADCFFVHSGLTYSGTAASTITGLDHLEGKEVEILTNGARHPRKTVSSGSITLSWTTTKAHIGLPYTSTLEPMKLHAGSPLGTARGKKQKISRLTICFYETYAGKYGMTDSSADLFEIPWSTGTAATLKTEDIDVEFQGDWKSEATIAIVQDVAFPMTVLGIVPRLSLNED